MPVSLTEISTEPSVCLALIPIRPPSGVNLTALDKQIEQYLLDLALVAEEIPKPVVHRDIERDAVLGGALAHEGARIVYGQGKIKRSQLQFHAAGFDLGEIENLIDERQEMAPGGENVVGVLGLFLV